MGIKLRIQVSGPLGPDDTELLSGVTMALLAMGQKLMAEETSEPQPCGDLEYDDDREATGRLCINEVGHKGRHKYRMPVSAPGGGGLN